MHASSMETVQRLLGRMHDLLLGPQRERLRVLDVGSMNVNGSYRHLLDDPRVEYIGADLESGPGVDVVLHDPYNLPFPDGSFDVILSGQMLEHCEQFWSAFAEMARVLAPDGVLLVVVPSAGPIHRYPVDCYRFYPDALYALARANGLIALDISLDERGPWNDLSGVFSRAPHVLADHPPLPPLSDPVNASEDPEEETHGGTLDYLDVLRTLHDAMGPSFYLEIGVHSGASLDLARCPAVGVDPHARVEAARHDHEVIALASDQPFANAGIAKSRVHIDMQMRGIVLARAGENLKIIE